MYLIITVPYSFYLYRTDTTGRKSRAKQRATPLRLRHSQTHRSRPTADSKYCCGGELRDWLACGECVARERRSSKSTHTTMSQHHPTIPAQRLSLSLPPSLSPFQPHRLSFPISAFLNYDLNGSHFGYHTSRNSKLNASQFLLFECLIFFSPRIKRLFWQNFRIKRLISDLKRLNACRFRNQCLSTSKGESKQANKQGAPLLNNKHVSRKKKKILTILESHTKITKKKQPT